MIFSCILVTKHEHVQFSAFIPTYSILINSIH